MADETGTETGLTEVPVGDAPTPTPATPIPANGAAPWWTPAESLKTSDPETWKAFENSVKSGGHKDLPTVVKHLVGLEKKLGSVLAPPDKGNVEQAKAFKDKLVKAGVDIKSLASEAPDSADKYTLKLDQVPEPMRSNDLMGKFRSIAHEEGLSQATVDKLTGLYGEMFTGTIEPALKYSYQQADQAIADYAKEIGKEPEVVKAYGGAWLKNKLKLTEDEVVSLERIGAANHPVLMKIACQAGLDTGEDISVIDGMAGATDNEYETLMNNLADKNHPEHKMFHAIGIDAQDPKRLAFMQRRQEILMRKFGTGEPKNT